MAYETFYREEPIEVRASRLPANIYNLSRRLLTRSDTGCVFVPIRTLQYLAVIDTEEIIFVDREAKHLVELAWRQFRPQEREALTDPVPYQLHIYLKKAFEILPRLQTELHKALQQIEERCQTGSTDVDEGRIVPFPTDRKTDK